jgi:hypothetical protein
VFDATFAGDAVEVCPEARLGVRNKIPMSAVDEAGPRRIFETVALGIA